MGGIAGVGTVVVVGTVVMGAVVVVGVVSVDVVSVALVSVPVAAVVVVSGGVSPCAPTAPPAIAPASRTAPSAATAAIFIRIVPVDPSPHHSLDHRALERMGRPTHILRTPELPSCTQHCVYEASGPESDGIVSRKPGVGLCGRDRHTRRVVVEPARVHG